MQLFCLTFAGGTAAFYNQLEDKINSAVSIEKLEYAGHGTRHKEPFYKDFRTLAEDMYEIIKSRLDGEYALMGYSMGSISVTEVLRLIIEKNDIPMPKYIFMAAHEPCSKTSVLSSSDNVDEYVKERTIRFGGVPEKLVNNNSFWRMYLPIYKNDYMMIEKYKFENLDLSTTIPLIVFYSEEDTPIDEMKDWTNYFIGQAKFIRYEGQHFFINQHCEEMCHEIELALGY